MACTHACAIPHKEHRRRGNYASPFASATPLHSTYCPVFLKQVVESNRVDGYWIETIPTPDKSLSLVGYGLGSQVINYYHNPHDPTLKGGWPKTEIQNLPSPVGMDKVDLRGTGFQDIVICTDYGKTMVDCDPNGGHIIWLENPGYKATADAAVEHWNKHYIGRSTAMHRLRIGHFSRTDKWQVLAFPIVREPHNLTGPVPVTIFTHPDDLMNATQWDSELVNDGYFHIIHDARVLDFGPFGKSETQTAIIASQEGLTWLYWDKQEGKFKWMPLAAGELGEAHQTSFYGTGGVDVGKTKQTNLAYIATCEPFHGNTIAVYVPHGEGADRVWRRHVLDVYGPPDIHGEGPVHYVVCADFDNDGDDEFLVALRGPFPYQGVFYYKATDLANGKFAKWQVSQDSAARIAIGDFDGDGYIDFATMAYNVPGYFTAADPAVNIYYNRFAQFVPQAKVSKVVVDKVDGQPLSVRVPRPANTLEFLTFPVVNIGGVEVALEVIPANSSLVVHSIKGVKVLHGSINWVDDNNKSHTRTPLIAAKTVDTITISTADGRIHTGAEGAVVFTFSTTNPDDIRYPTIESIPITFHAKAGTNWKKVDSLDWGKGRFDGLEFYNLEGIKIGFLEDSQHLAYVQFWAAGVDVNCGIHNHSTDHFAEVHTCLVNGTGGGMEYTQDATLIPSQITKELEEKMIKLKVPSFHEHGPLWVISQEDQPVSRQDGTVVYPVHKWQALSGDGKGQSYDTWAAFELLPILAVSPHTLHSFL